MPRDEEMQDEFTLFLIQLFQNLQLLQEELEDFSEISFENNRVEIEEHEVWEGIEDRFSQWMSSFYGILIYLMCNVVSFAISVINPVFTFLPVLLLVIFPFYSWGIFIYSIPEIVINNKIVFSRKDLSLRLQFRIARAMFRFFLVQMYRFSKIGIGFLVFFLVFFVFVVLDRFFWHIAY